MNISQKLIYGSVVFLLSMVLHSGLLIAAPTSAQVISGQTQQDLNDLRNKRFEQKVSSTTASPDALIDEAQPKVRSSLDNKEKFLVNKINVLGVTILTNIEVYKIITPYQGTQMSFTDIQKVADLITDLYRAKGFITSRAYLPEQTIVDGTLIINVLEGRLGKVEIQGNKYFKTTLLQRKLQMSPSGYFDYSGLQRSLVYINQHPDRVAKTVLVPGTEPGTTDVIVNVKDRLPIHAGFIYDNYGSRYIGHNRYALTLEDNNLLGFDDRMYAKVQTSESNYMRFAQLQYLVPVTKTLNIGAYGVYSNLVLGREFEDLEAKGKALVLGVFADQALIQDAGFEWRLNGGFDYKNISNYELGERLSYDKVRVFKLGTGLDITDRWGRTIINPEFNVGVPEILNGMDSKDPMASRAGSGGSFNKGLIQLYRLQPLPLSTSLLWKNSGQWSNYNLPSSEQFQIGGPHSVRGYGPAEFSGDKGLYSALEWSVPPYFIPDTVKVPLTDVSLKDSLRAVAFYDVGFVHLNNTSVGEQKNETLKGWGYGARLNVRDNLIVRFELGHPIGRTSSDGNKMHPWIEVIARY